MNKLKGIRLPAEQLERLEEKALQMSKRLKISICVNDLIKRAISEFLETKTK